jgi:hypothetical protein
MQTHIGLYGGTFVKPKFHWAWHCWGDWLAHGIVVDMFVIERMHQDPRFLASIAYCTTKLERTIMSRMLARQMARAKGQSQTQLVGKLQEHAQFPGLSFSQMSVNDFGLSVSRNGFVFLPGGAARCLGRVMVCFASSADEGVRLCVEVLLLQ